MSVLKSKRTESKAEFAKVQFITHRRFKDRAICGDVNLPALSKCELQGDAICFNGKPICLVTSENAHQYFARNDDGFGVERGRLTQEIQKKLAKRDDNYQARWDKVWEDKTCQKYKRQDHDDFWLWSHEFFNAKIEDLRYIAKLVGVK